MRPKLTALVMISLLATTAACNRARVEASAPPPPPPCTTGLNGTTCETSIQGHTTWIKTANVLNDETKEVVKVVTTIHENYLNRDGVPSWRRSVTVTSPQGKAQSMLVSGRVLEVDDKTIRLTVDRTSCDSIDQGFSIRITGDEDGARTMYYSRHGNHLSLRTRPFPTVESTDEESKSLGDVIGKAIGQVVAQSMAAMLDSVIGVTIDLFTSALTLGFLFDELKDGVGTYQKVDLKESFAADKGSAFYGDIGCFRGGRAVQNEFKAADDIERLLWVNRLE